MRVPFLRDGRSSSSTVAETSKTECLSVNSRQENETWYSRSLAFWRVQISRLCPSRCAPSLPRPLSPNGVRLSAGILCFFSSRFTELEIVSQPRLIVSRSMPSPSSSTEMKPEAVGNAEPSGGVPPVSMTTRARVALASYAFLSSSTNAWISSVMRDSPSWNTTDA